MAFVMTTVAVATPAQVYTDLAITSHNLNTLNSFTNSGAWYNVGANSYLLKWYGGGEYFEAGWKAPAVYYGIITATIMADYQGYNWGECVSMVKNLAHNTDDVSFTGDVDNYRYLMYYYPNEKGTRTFQIWHESFIGWDKLVLVEAFWSSDGKKWNKFTQKSVNFYPLKRKISLYSGSSNIRYMFLVGVPDQPNGPSILTFHAKFY